MPNKVFCLIALIMTREMMLDLLSLLFYNYGRKGDK